MNARPLVVSVATLLALAGCGGESQTAAAVDTPGTVAEAAASTAPPPVKDEQRAITVGSAAPDFELPGSDGNTHKLSDFAGQHVVLAFFPKAFTGG